MSLGFGFALPAYPLRGGGGNNPFNQSGPTLDLSFVGTAGDLSGADTYTLNTDFITPEYQVAAQYAVWENGVGLAQKTFSQIVTFTRASTGTYFNSAGTLTTAAINEARFDYDPATLLARGFLIEEARTNSIRNNTMQGASAGVAPTNWLGWNVTTNGVTIASSAAGTENGIAYIDVAVSGTCTLTGTAQTPSFETATQVAATVGQTWTESVYWTLVSGSLGDSSFNVRLTEADSGGLSLASGDSATVVPAVGNLRSARYTFTRTLTNASTAFLIPRLRFGFVNGSTYSFTLRIGLPQLEQGAFATSVIPTTVIAATRSADVASVNTLSPWFNATEGTLFVEASSFALTDIDNAAVTIANGTSTDFINAAISNVGAVNRINSSITAGGVVQVTGFNTPNGSYTQDGTVYRAALGYKTNDSAWACSISNTLATDATVTIPTGMDRLIVGAYYVAGNRLLNGYLRRITYYPRRLANVDLQTITT